MIHPLSLISFSSFMALLYFAVNVLRSNPRSYINRGFAAMTGCWSLIAFAYTFLYTPQSYESMILWKSVASVGWFFAPAFTLHATFFLIKKNHLGTKWWIYPLIYLPASFFLLNEIFGTQPVLGYIVRSFGGPFHSPSKPLFVGFVLMSFSYFSGSLGMIMYWFITAKSAEEKSQARMIIISGIPILTVGTVTDALLPLMDMAPVPPLAPILIVVWLAALWTAVTKFNLMDITPSMISGSFLKNFDIYQTLIENFTDIIWTMDRSMKLTFISESVRSLLGYTPEEMMELSFDRYVTPASFKISTRMLAEEFEREGKTGVPPDRTGRADVEYIRKDGTTMWAEIHVRFIRFDDKITGIMGISRDVSKRRETEDKLRLSEEKYRQLVEHAGDIIYQTDTGGAFTYINPNVEKAVGYPMDKLIGVVFTEFMPEKYRDTMMKFYAKQYHTRTIETSHEVPMQTSDGRIVWFEQNVRLLLEGDSVIGFQGIARDITDRKSMEDQLRQRNDIIEHDLTNAQFIQQALLPAVPPQWHPVKTSFRFQPMEKIGGDFFSFTTYQEGGLGVFIGDVSGHGVSAALYLSLLKANTDRACRSHGLHPGALLTSLNKELASSMPNGFVTAIYGLFQTDPETGIPGFTFACGGHPLPVLQRKGGKTAELTGIHGPVLGSFKGRDYFETIASLRQGDRLYLYTDGIPEARNSREEIIGFDELPGIISSLSKDDLDESLDAVIDYCRKFRGAENQDDDIVLIGFEVL